jgi:hypothetical protein
MTTWGDSVARGFLGCLAVGMIGCAVASWWLGHELLAGPLLIFGLIFAIACAYYRNTSGEFGYRGFRLSFRGPGRQDESREEPEIPRRATARPR